jgi:hypothetical protein
VNTSTEAKWAQPKLVRRSRLAHNLDRLPARPIVRASTVVSQVVSPVWAWRARVNARALAVGPMTGSHQAICSLSVWWGPGVWSATTINRSGRVDAVVGVVVMVCSLGEGGGERTAGGFPKPDGPLGPPPLWCGFDLREASTDCRAVNPQGLAPSDEGASGLDRTRAVTHHRTRP